MAFGIAISAVAVDIKLHRRYLKSLSLKQKYILDDKEVTINSLQNKQSPSLANSVSWLFVAIAFIVFLRSAWVGDDAMITLRSVLNFVNGFGPVFNISERVQAFTHTSWFMLLSLGTLIFKNPYLVVVVFSLLINCANVYVITRFFGVCSVLLLFALFFSKSFIDYANSGLENPLSYLLMTLLVVLMHGDARENTRKWFWVGVVCSLLVLNRPEFGLILLCLLVTHFSRINYLSLCVGLIPLFIWECFSFVYYGSLVPNTALAKLNTGIPKGESITQGLEYIKINLVNDPLTLFCIALFLVLAITSKKLWYLGLFTLLYVLYIVWVGGDFMGGRFLSVPFFSSILGVGLFLKYRQISTWQWLVCISLILGLGHKNIYANFIAGSQFSDTKLKKGVADERGYYFKQFAVINSDAGRFPKVGKWQRPDSYPEKVWVGCGFLGQHGLAGGPGLHMIDTCALSDALLARIPMRYYGPGIWRSGHYMRQLPSNYKEYMLGSVGQLGEPLAQVLLDDVQRVISGSIWERDRFIAIWRVNFKDYGLHDLYANHIVPRSITTVSYQDINHDDASGLYWNDPKATKFRFGLEVAEINKLAKSVQLSLDNNDVYEVDVIGNDGQLIVSELIQDSYEVLGLVATTIELPEAQFVSRVIIKEGRSDGKCSVGHIRVD